jgi:hypothetical protein
MVSFASRYRMPVSIRKDRPLTNEELQLIVPSAFSSDKHDSRSERYTYIPTINILDRLRDEGFSRIMQRSHVHVTRINATLQNICFACVVMTRLTEKKYRKLFC